MSSSGSGLDLLVWTLKVVVESRKSLVDNVVKEGLYNGLKVVIK